MDDRVDAVLPELERIGYGELLPALREQLARQPHLTVFNLLQERTIRISWKRELRSRLREIFSGRAYEPDLIVA